jgi:3-hydroxyacyl-CoA dehydrogenase
VKERLLYRQLVETARFFAEGVLETPEDGDLGAIFGWGFMPHTGGPFSAMDTIGLATVVQTLDRLEILVLSHRHQLVLHSDTLLVTQNRAETTTAAHLVTPQSW